VIGRQEVGRSENLAPFWSDLKALTLKRDSGSPFAPLDDAPELLNNAGL